MVSVLTFTHGKHTVLRFAADTLQVQRKETGEDALILHATGTIEYQETPAIEAMIAGDYACGVTLTQAGEEILQGRFLVTLLVLESHEMVVQLQPD